MYVCSVMGILWWQDFAAYLRPVCSLCSFVQARAVHFESESRATRRESGATGALSAVPPGSLAVRERSVTRL